MAQYILNKKKLLPTETAALFMYVFEGETDWKKVFAAAADWTEEEMEENPLKLTQYTSKWKAMQKFKNELQRIKLYRDRFVKQIQDQAFEEGRRSVLRERPEPEDGESYSGGVDYTDPKKQKQKLNDIINNAKDSGEALDALKIIISGQRQDTEAAKNNKVQRFYTPLQCRDCPLYQEKKESLKK